MRTISPLLRAAALSLALGGCGTTQALVSQEPTVAEGTGVHGQLTMLPPPVKPVLVAVYGYQDQTGQYKASDTVQSLSRAVTQGAAPRSSSRRCRTPGAATGSRWSSASASRTS